MGLTYETGRFPDYLWARHVERFPSAGALLTEGTEQHPAFPGLAQDTHALLYLRHTPAPKDDAPTWAVELLREAQQLPEFAQLRRRCERNGLLAGIGAESLLPALIPLLPEEEKGQEEKTAQEGPSRPPGSTNGTPQDPGAGQPGDTPAPDDAGTLRRALRQACREATRTVGEAEQATDSMLQAMGSKQGQGPGTQESLQSLDEVRSVYALLRDNPQLKNIAELAGRLRRLGQAHKRTLVTPAVGSIKGITLGGDLERVLPSELAGLRSPVKLLRLQTLDRIMNKRALQYLWRGVESETRGPIICLVDESGSMGGSKEVLAKAVTLSLLTIAMEQKRGCYVITFDDCVQREYHFLPDKVDIKALCDALMTGHGGGTNFHRPLLRALEVLREEPTMHKADLLMITDGEASIGDDVAENLQKAKAQHGLHCYGVLIEDDATGESLAPIADELYHVSSEPGQDNGRILPLFAKIA